MTATGIEYSFPLSPLQEGMLFHALYAPAPACTSNSSWVSSTKSWTTPRFDLPGSGSLTGILCRVRALALTTRVSSCNR